MSEDDDDDGDDESDKHLETRDRRYSCLIYVQFTFSIENYVLKQFSVS